MPGIKGLTSTSMIPLLVISSLLLIGYAFFVLTSDLTGTFRESLRILRIRQER